MSNQTHNSVTIRRLGHSAADREALRELAERDSGAALTEPVLVAEVDGRALAAVSLADRRVLADPFEHTDELRSLLALRAAQFHRRERRSRRRLEFRGVGRARAALAGSPPGAGGRLLDLR
jgi:hypothetical protein